MAASVYADEEAEEILKTCANRYATLKAFSAKMSVTTSLADVELQQEATLLLAEGEKILFTLRDRDTLRWASLVHSDGKFQYRLDWKEKKIFRQRVTASGKANVPYFFPSFDRYVMASARLEEILRDDHGRDLYRISVELGGTVAKSVFRYQRLVIVKDEGTVSQIEMMSPLKRTLMTVRFKDVKVDEKLDDEDFRWEKPIGLEDVPVVDLGK